MQICNTSEKIRLVIHHLMKLETPESLQDGSKGTIRHLKCLDDLGNGTEAMVEKTPAEVRTTLDVYSKTEVQNYVTTQINAITDYEAVSF